MGSPQHFCAILSFVTGLAIVPILVVANGYFYFKAVLSTTTGRAARRKGAVYALLLVLLRIPDFSKRRMTDESRRYLRLWLATFAMGLLPAFLILIAIWIAKNPG